MSIVVVIIRSCLVSLYMVFYGLSSTFMVVGGVPCLSMALRFEVNCVCVAVECSEAVPEAAVVAQPA